jgi:hypothetical protein
VGVLDDGPDVIVGKAGGIFWVVAIDGELVAVVSIEAILCAEPEEACSVLQDAGDVALGKTVVGAEMAEFDRDGLRKRAKRYTIKQ